MAQKERSWEKGHEGRGEIILFERFYAFYFMCFYLLGSCFTTLTVFTYFDTLNGTYGSGHRAPLNTAAWFCFLSHRCVCGAVQVKELRSVCDWHQAAAVCSRHVTLHRASWAMWESRWPSWAVRPNEPSGFRGRKAVLNRASAMVTACP